MHIKPIKAPFFSPEKGNVSSFRPRHKRLIFLLMLFYLFPQFIEAQCAMCRAVVESEADGNMAEGINNGIVYLMAIPYILVAGLFFLVYKKLKN